MIHVISSRTAKKIGLVMPVIILVLVFMPVLTASAQGANTWLAEYYGNMELQGNVLYTEVLPGPFLNAEWPNGEGPRKGGVPDDGFSARFTTRYTFAGGNVKFALNSDDGSRLYLNGEVIIDQWFDRPATWYEVRVLTVPAGTYSITVEYYDREGANQVNASFASTTDLPSQNDKDWVPGGSGGGGTGGSGGGAGGDGQGGGGDAGGGSPTAPSGDGWLAEYYGNMELSGPVLFTETIPGFNLSKEWPYGEGPRQGGVPDDEWSARFTAQRTLPAGNIKFYLASDDGSRMYLNGFLIIDAWQDRPASWYETRVLPIQAGGYTITIEYYDHFGANSIEAGFIPTSETPSADDQDFALPDWAQPTPPTGGGGSGGSGGGDGQGGGGSGGTGGGSPATPPAGGVTIDDGDAAFSWAGSQEWGFGFGGLINNLYLYTGNSEVSYKMWARWNPYLGKTGNWDVYAYIPVHGNGTANARYRISHAGILSPVIAVNQQANAGKWVRLGTFWFNAGISHYLYLNDLTFEPENSRDVLYDAAKFVFIGN